MALIRRLETMSSAYKKKADALKQLSGSIVKTQRGLKGFFLQRVCQVLEFSSRFGRCPISSFPFHSIHMPCIQYYHSSHHVCSSDTPHAVILSNYFLQSS